MNKKKEGLHFGVIPSVNAKGYTAIFQCQDCINEGTKVISELVVFGEMCMDLGKTTMTLDNHCIGFDEVKYYCKKHYKL